MKSRIAFIIYAELRRKPAKTGYELAQRIDSPPSVVYPLLKSLMSEGIIERKEDGYLSSVSITTVNIGGNKLLLPNVRPP